MFQAAQADNRGVISLLDNCGEQDLPANGDFRV
jgi:hypothetical protein